jgi:GT2 family glycosyltransferase
MNNIAEKKVDLSIVIVNWNGRDLLEDCLSSIYARTYRHTIEIIIVDNASTDGSVEMLRGKYPDIRLIVNAENLGFNKANNIGIRQSTGSYILLLNNDTIIEDDAFDRMLDFMEAHPDAGAMGPRVLNADKTFQLQCRRGHLYPGPMVCYMLGLHKIFPKNRLFGHYVQSYIDPDHTHEVDVISGCCFLFRREILDEVGLMDEQFFFYGDDCDYSLRIWQAGWKIYYVHDISIIHLKGSSVNRQKKDFHLDNLFSSYLLYYNKHFAQKHSFPMRLLVRGIVKSGHKILKIKNHIFNC